MLLRQNQTSPKRTTLGIRPSPKAPPQTESAALEWESAVCPHLRRVRLPEPKHLALQPPHLAHLSREGEVFEPHRVADLVIEFHVNSFTQICTPQRA